MDSEEDLDDELEPNYYEDYPRLNHGQQGRPQLMHFDFLPASIRELDISSTIRLAPDVSMSKLSRVELLTLGALWPWQLTPTTASSYWPPQLKQLKFKKSADDLIHFFHSIDVSTITFPSTLTELELPEKTHQLFTEEESKQVNAIQYPTGLVKLVNPFLPHTFAEWRLPETLTYLECKLRAYKTQFDLSNLVFPKELRTLVLNRLEFDLSKLNLPTSLTSLTIPPSYKSSLKSLKFPASLTEFNYPKTCAIPFDWSHTMIKSFTVANPLLQPLASYTLPPTVTLIEFSTSHCLPIVPASYVWPPQVSEVQFESNFGAAVIDLKNPAAAAGPSFHLPSTLRRLVIHSSFASGSFSQLRIPEGLEAITIRAYGYQPSWAELVLPSSLKEFTFLSNAPSVQLPSLANTKITRLELPATWSRQLSTKDFALPSTLTSLRFGDRFNFSLPQLRLPTGLTELRFGSDFNQSVAPLVSQMPQHLRVFALGNSDDRQHTSFSQLSSLMDLHFPSTLQEIVLPSPESQGIILSPFHTRYTDFVSKLQEKVKTVKLIESFQKKENVV